MTIDLTQIIVALIGVIGTVITIYVIPLLKSKVSKEQWDRLQEIAFVAVEAAEKLGLTGVIDDKLGYATERVEAILKKYGLTFDAETIRSAIEAAVLALDK